MSNAVTSLSEEGLNKAAEYFKIKKAMTELRRDKADLMSQHSRYQEMQKMAKQIKEIRDEIKEDEMIKEITEKLSEQKERMDLLKEMIRIELIENSAEEVVQDGKVLKLIYVVKETKGNDKN